MIPGCYGSRMAKHWQLPSAASLTLNAVPERQLVLTRINVPCGADEPTKRIPPERAHGVEVHLQRPGLVTGWGSWMDGHFRPVRFWDLGGLEMYNLQADPIFLRRSGFESVHIHIPHQTIGSYIETCESVTFTDFHCPTGVRDDTIFRWVNMLIPFFGHQHALPLLMVDEAVMMFCSYVLKHHQATPPKTDRVVGALALWQQRRATRMICENLDGELNITDLAGECGLSPSHFARAFKRSFGVPAHRFLIQKRIEAAKSLILHTEKTLLDVALECGFTDQSAFNRTFRTLVGTTPGAWRREKRSPPISIAWSGRALMPIGPTAALS
jgi:AraC family transcriptional regulator